MAKKEERQSGRSGKAGTNMTPEDILARTRKLIEEHSGEDPDKWWYANHYVFVHLMRDERKTKDAITERLMAAKQPCHFCKKPIAVEDRIHLYRLDETKGYRDGNCILMHEDCHKRRVSKFVTELSDIVFVDEDALLPFGKAEGQKKKSQKK